MLLLILPFSLTLQRKEYGTAWHVKVLNKAVVQPVLLQKVNKQVYANTLLYKCTHWVSPESYSLLAILLGVLKCLLES